MDDLLALLIVVGSFILAIFVVDHLHRQWRADEWKRRLKRRLKEDRRGARH